MASITIRNLDDNIKQRLRVQAAEHGHSMEEEARAILRAALAEPASSRQFGPCHTRSLRALGRCGTGHTTA